jgi:hypothetical protein
MNAAANIAQSTVTTTPRPSRPFFADCHNCGIVRARDVTQPSRFFEPGLYCPLCDAGPLPPAEPR